MSRQYLKSLQERAQKLLKQSSQDELEEDIHAYTATQREAKSPKAYNLNEFLHYDTQSQSEQPENEDDTIGDVELLKKMISIQNQNNSLKNIINQQTKQIYHLKNEILSSKTLIQKLEKELQQNSNDYHKINDERQQNMQQEYLQKILQEIQNHQNSLNQKEIGLLQKQQQLNKRQNERHSHQQTGSNQRNVPKNRLKSDRNKFLKSNNQPSQMNVVNQYTIKNIKTNDNNVDYQELATKIRKLETIIEQMQKYNNKMQKRLNSVDKKKEQLQWAVGQQKKKNYTLVGFINKEIPHLNTIIVQLTAKLDVRLEKIMLNKSKI